MTVLIPSNSGLYLGQSHRGSEQSQLQPYTNLHWNIRLPKLCRRRKLLINNQDIRRLHESCPTQRVPLGGHLVQHCLITEFEQKAELQYR